MRKFTKYPQGYVKASQNWREKTECKSENGKIVRMQNVSNSFNDQDYYVLFDADGNFVEKSLDFNYLHKKLYGSTATNFSIGYVKADIAMKDFSNTEINKTFQDFAYSNGDISEDSVQWEFPDNQDIIEQVIDSWNQGNDTITNFLMDYYGFDEDDIAELDDTKFADCLLVEDVEYDPIESSNQGIPAYRVTIFFDYDKYLKG